MPRNYSARQLREFEIDLLGVMLFSSIAFNLLDSLFFRGFIRKWMPGIKVVPMRHAKAGPVLERLLATIVVSIKEAYSAGAFVSLSFDGWKSIADRKLIGMLASLVDISSGALTVDFRGTTDITSLAETTELVVGQVEKELSTARAANDNLTPLPSGHVDDACASVLTSIVSDSASCNVGAKKQFAQKHPSIIMVACTAHQFNLLTANIITHPALKPSADKCSKLVSFLKQSTKYWGQLQMCMDETLGWRKSLERRGETRWFSHHAVVQRLLELKPALESFSNKFNADRALRATANGAAVIDLLRSQSFWDETELMARLLKPIVIEIGLIGKRTSNLADVCAAFGRLHAYYKQLRAETAMAPPVGGAVSPLFFVAADPAVTALTHQICGSVLGFLQWLLSKYFDASLLVLAHLLDPKRHVNGLRTTAGSPAEYANLMRLFLSLAARFGLPKAGDIPAEKESAEAVKTVQAFSAYLGGGNKDLLAFDFPPGGGPRIAAVGMWQMATKFRGTILHAVARWLLSVPALAAEMERVWSGMGLANTPIRNRINTDRLTTMTKVVVHMRAVAAAARRPRVTYAPGSLVGETLAAGVASGGGAEAGVRLSTINEDDGDELEVDAIDEEEGLDKAAGELQEALDEEHLPMGEENVAPIVLGDGGTAEVDVSEADGAAAADLVRAVTDFIRTGCAAAPATSGEVTNGADGPRWTVDSTSHLGDLFNTEWDLAHARVVYRK